jgi:hypothetical protein
MSFLLAAVVALVAGPGTARLVDLVSHSGGFLGVGAGVIVIALGEIMLLAGAIAPSVETAARVRSAASASDQAPIVGAISVMAEAAEIAAPNSASKEPRSQEQAKPPAVDEASEREAAPPRGSPAPQRVVNDEPKRGTMKKVLIAVPLVLVIAIIGVVWSTSHVEVTVTHPKPPAISWGTNCKLNMELPASMGSGGYPEPFATVKITDAGKNIQEFNAYRLYFWSGGIIVGFWNGHPGTTYESPGESWTSTSNVSSGSGAWEAVEPPESPASGAGVWSAIYEPTGQPMTCTVGSVT